jgi:ParB-like chromosome segregation protein Spo0J
MDGTLMKKKKDSDILKKFKEHSGGAVVKQLKIEYIDPLELSPNSYNPNLHDTTTFDMLLGSLKYFGFTQPVVANKDTTEIIDGEHRWRCACILEMEKIPVVWLSLTPEQMRVATIIHNRARGKEDGELVYDIEQQVDGSKGTDYYDLLLKDRNGKQ